MADHPLTTRDLAGRSDDRGPVDTEKSTRPREPDGDTVGAVDEQGAEVVAADAHMRGESDLEAASTEQRRTDDSVSAGAHGPLLPTDQTERLTVRWQEIQTGFVDRPRESVEHADALVADLMQRLAASFSHEREQLEAQWDGGDDVSTEDLRVALTRYRSFFDRLLSA